MVYEHTSNSLPSRNDLASEDLLLDNKWESAEKRKAQREQRQKKTKKAAPKRTTTSRKKAEIETAFHYIAYVPVDGQVWELDGLETQPLCVGKKPRNNPNPSLLLAKPAVNRN